MAFIFSKVYPRLCVRFKHAQLSFVKCVNRWGHKTVQSKALGWLCFSARLTLADRLPKTRSAHPFTVLLRYLTAWGKKNGCLMIRTNSIENDFSCFWGKKMPYCPLQCKTVSSQKGGMVIVLRRNGAFSSN